MPGDSGSSGALLSPLELTVNGDAVRAAVPASRTLLEFLRYDLGLTGSKQGCDKGDCGACTVILNGKAVLSCITLALEAGGAIVETVESLARGTTLHPLQDAFVRHGAAQCGFCTPGILMSAKVLLDATVGREAGAIAARGAGAAADREAGAIAARGAGAAADREAGAASGPGDGSAPQGDGRVPTRDAIKHALSGNLCRCTGYTKILDAVEDAARALAGGASAPPRKPVSPGTSKR
jgi:aerobic-type carbon monoxide dehydrogenase small subunit (CoxS/CutS family)